MTEHLRLSNIVSIRSLKMPLGKVQVACEGRFVHDATQPPTGWTAFGKRSDLEEAVLSVAAEATALAYIFDTMRFYI